MNLETKKNELYKALIPYGLNTRVEIDEEYETFTIDIDGIEEGKEGDTLDSLNDTLSLLGFRIIADEASTHIGKIWTLVE